MVVRMVAGAGAQRQIAVQIGGDRAVGIGFCSNQRLNALGGETLLQTWSHAASDQHLHRIQRMRLLRRAFMERLL